LPSDEAACKRAVYGSMAAKKDASREQGPLQDGLNLSEVERLRRVGTLSR